MFYLNISHSFARPFCNKLKSSPYSGLISTLQLKHLVRFLRYTLVVLTRLNWEYFAIVNAKNKLFVVINSWNWKQVNASDRLPAYN